MGVFRMLGALFSFAIAALFGLGAVGGAWVSIIQPRIEGSAPSDLMLTVNGIMFEAWQMYILAGALFLLALFFAFLGFWLVSARRSPA